MRAGILAPVALLLSLEARERDALVHLAYIGAASLAVGLLVLSVGTIRSGRTARDAKGVVRKMVSKRGASGQFDEDEVAVRRLGCDVAVATHAQRLEGRNEE